MIETKFKQTEVGLIPEDWRYLTVGELCKVNTGSKNTQDKKENGKYPFYVRSNDVERIDTYTYDCEAVLTAGDGVGTGKVFHYINGKFDVHQRVYIMNNFTDCIDGKYFYLVFAKNFYSRVHSMTAKSSVDSVRKEMITQMSIAVPPLPEQQRIANVLTDIDSLLLSLDNLITKKKAIKEGAMQQLLTGKKRLKGFDEPWVEKKIGDCLSIGNGRDYKHLTKGNVPVYGTGGLMCYVSDYLYNGETVCIGRKGTIDTPFFHKGRIWTVDTLFFTHSFIGVVPKYTYYLFTQIKWKELNEATGVPSLNKNNILSVKVKLPTLLEQQAIAQVLTNMDIEISALEAKRKKYESVKQGMMQQLLTGKIRLTSTPKRETLFFS